MFYIYCQPKDSALKIGRTNEVLKLQLQQDITMNHQDLEFWAKTIQLFEDLFNLLNFFLEDALFIWKYIYLKNKFPSKSYVFHSCIFNQFGILSFALCFLLCFYQDNLRSEI